MAKFKVAINGMGRIGRTILREWINREIDEFDIVAVNNPGKMKSHAHLVKYDSVHGVFKGEVRLDDDILTVKGRKVKFYKIKKPDEIPWSDQEVDIVIDGTGVFKDQEKLSGHLGGTVKKVIMCAPGKDLDATFVMGINNQEYKPGEHHIVSNASCTTNCLAPVAKVLHEKFGIESGLMTTIHAYTGDQNILDASHRDYRRGRAAALSMIPTTTGAAKALGLVIPELLGKMDGYAVRVPTADVSMVDLTVCLEKEATVEEINDAMMEYSKEQLKGVLGYNDLPLVSIDFTGTRESSIFDAGMTNVLGKTAKIVAWYDNEVGFSNRVLDLAAYMGARL
ncbi:MAG: type I glyceraldehyde-3-phosphate dehydrogenase [Bacteriovoracaceae bacterium]|jgi:glyceraldehyde 3-phosphate dehydrogenase|nr:type I glyceraldehyde-3-phosphate dehydrogenase [Bacteriovoracaceae bacterium]